MPPNTLILGSLLMLGVGGIAVFVTMAACAVLDILDQCSARKVGGIWFMRLGRYQLSYCRCRV